MMVWIAWQWRQAVSSSSCGSFKIALAQRFSHGMSARGQKGIGHAAADDERVDFCEQAAEQVELGRYLGSADDRGERTDGGLQYVGERLELVLHGAASIGRQPVADALDRGVGAVRHREGVVDEDVAERGELRDEIGIVALLARMEAGVLQAQDVCLALYLNLKTGRCDPTVRHIAMMAGLGEDDSAERMARRALSEGQRLGWIRRIRRDGGNITSG
jgi:hypothetical protein